MLDVSYPLCAAVTRIPWPISDRTWSIQVHNRREVLLGVDAFVSSWTYVQGSGNMVDNTGYWTVKAWPGGRSLVHYAFRADAGLHVPDFIERRATAGMLPSIVDNLRQRSEAP